MFTVMLIQGHLTRGYSLLVLLLPLTVAQRQHKSLANTFPFSQGTHHSHGSHGSHGSPFKSLAQSPFSPSGFRGFGSGFSRFGGGLHQSPRPRVAFPSPKLQPVPISPAYETPEIPVIVAPTFPISARVIPPKNPYQGRQPQGGQTFSAVAAAGKKCIDKIETVQEIEYDEVEKCDHSYDKQCHTSYVTEFESQQEEECEDNYKKSCEIVFSPRAQNVTVKKCMKPLVKDCSITGPEICRTEYISECSTRNDPHVVEDDVASCRTVKEEKCENVQNGYTTEEKCTKWPREVCTVQKELRKKYNPVTKCEKVPQQLCGPSGCGFREGPEVCHDEVKSVVTDSPEEVCDIQPRRTCKHVTTLVPKLSPQEECVDVPKEVCTKGKTNPRTVQKPVTKKWCYVPSKESGLV